MQWFLVLSAVISLSSATWLNQYILRMATQHLDPLTRSLIQPALGEILFDMDQPGGKQQSNSYGSMFGSTPYDPMLLPMSYPASNMVNPIDPPFPSVLSANLPSAGPAESPFSPAVPAEPPFSPAVLQEPPFFPAVPAGLPLSSFGTANLPPSSTGPANPPLPSEGTADEPLPSSLFTTNIISPSTVDPSKDTNPYSSGANAIASPGDTLVSPQAVPVNMPMNTGQMAPSPYGSYGYNYPPPRRTNFFQNFMMMRLLQMMEFF